MTQTPSSYRLGYRSDIEGLRAIAIVLVVAAHARISWLAGGFVGVDVFFVLSGYLISGLLLDEIRRSGTIDLAQFYVRRLRRLLPGLLLMLAVAAPACRLFEAPAAQPEQANAAASAALWVSNFFFAFQNIDYFRPGAESNPFLHTWSLGVEEQFYLVWPLLLALTTGAWAGATRTPRSGRVKVAMPIVLAASLAASAAWTFTQPTLAFYMMPARAWQFATGALVYIWFGSSAGSGQNDSSVALRAPVWIGWCGVAVIVGCGTLISTPLTYPWPWALLPALGTAAVLAAGAHGAASGAGSVLSLKPMQAIGRVSYSWYLWHWPVILLGDVLIDTSQWWVRVALALVSLLLAACAYRWFELPVRRIRFALHVPRASIACALVLMVVSASVGIAWHLNAIDRMHAPEQKRYVQLYFDSPIVYGLGCDSWYSSAAVRPCSFGPVNAPHTAVIMGDSVGMQWFPAVARIFHEPEWRLVALTKSSCPMVNRPFFYERIHRVFTECEKWRAVALREVAALNPEVVVIGSTYTYGYSDQQWIEGTTEVLRPLSGHAGQVFLLRSTPRLPFSASSCLPPRSELYRKLSRNSECVANASSAANDAVFGWLATAARGFENVSLVDMTDAVCPEGVCHAERDGVIVFRDDQHLTTRFVESLTGALARALGQEQPSATQRASRPSESPPTS